MKRLWFVVLFCAALSVATENANASSLQDGLACLNFMSGHWSAGPASGAGGNRGGTSVISSELDGRLMLRRDHVRLADGHDLNILMTVMSTPDGLAASFYDSEGHVIHYVGRCEASGRVVFESAPATPRFRLTYEGIGGGLSVTFEIAPNGEDYQIYAQGALRRSRHAPAGRD